MVKKLKDNYYLFIKVLQNGEPVADLCRSLKKRGSVTLSSSLEEDFSLPFYPFATPLELAYIHKSKVELFIPQSAQGFVTSSGQIHRVQLKGRSERTYDLESGDYCSLVVKDLRLLIKIAKKPFENKIAKDSRYNGKIFSLFIRDKYEKSSLMTAVFLAFLVVCGGSGALLMYKDNRPQKFEELSDVYTLPFINWENLKTSPEALKTNLDRNNYIGSVVEYYRSFTNLYMGWTNFNSHYLFPSSIQYFLQKHEKLHEEIALMNDKQKETLGIARQDKHAALIVLPSIVGESFREKLVRLIRKIDTMHKGFEYFLERRYVTTKEFMDDPDYDWNLYNKIKKSKFTVPEELSKIKVFDQITNEKRMYEDGKNLGIRAKNLAKTQELSSAKKHWLDERAVSRILIATDISGIYFQSENFLPTTDYRLHEIEGSQLGKKPTEEKIKEPLIGEINPRLIEETIIKHRFELNLCYEFALRRDHDTRGSMHWMWRVDSRGKISDIALSDTNVHDRDMIDCVRQKMQSWSFPPPTRGSVKVSHSFNFEPQSG